MYAIQSIDQVSVLLDQGLYTEMKFERPSRIQATTLPMILRPPYCSMIAQVCRCRCSMGGTSRITLTLC